MTFPAVVTIREVGTRDGIQSLGTFIPTEQKIQLVNALTDTGIRRIEAASFVNPRAVPQMADAAQVMHGIARRTGVAYEVLVPNVRGAEDALTCRPDRLVLVVTASETFNRKNVRMSVDESLRQFASIKGISDAAGVPCTAVVGTAFGCPYEGAVAEETVLGLVARLASLGFAEIGLADTTGMANPLQVEHLMRRVLDRWSAALTVGLHFHNTRGLGLANVVAGLNAGGTLFDASVGGLGGCPFAPSASGNISTEDAVHLLGEIGVDTGIDLRRLLEAAQLAQRLVGRELPGQVMKAGPRWQLHAA